MVFKDKLNSNKQNKIVQVYYLDAFTINAYSLREINISANNLGITNGNVLFALVNQYYDNINFKNVYQNVTISHCVINNVITSGNDIVIRAAVYNGNSSEYNIPIIFRAFIY